MNALGDVWFVGNSDVLKARVEPLVWTRMAKAFNEAGWQVTLISPYSYRPRSVRKRDLQTYYDTPPEVSFHILPTPLWQSAPTWYYRLAVLPAYFIYALAQFLRRAANARLRGRLLIVYGRGYISYSPFLLLGKLFSRVLRLAFVFETTAIQKSRYDRLFLMRADVVVVSSSLLKRDVVDMGIEEKRVLIAYLAPIIEGHPSYAEGRRWLVGRSLPTTPMAIYTGRVTPPLRQLLETIAADLLESDIHVAVAGGTERHQSSLSNLHYLGFVSPREIGSLQAGADVLLNIVNPVGSTYPYLVPGKLLDYLHAGRPIVSMPFPALEEIVPPGAVLVGESPGEVAQAVREVVGNPELGEQLASAAAKVAEELSWRRRVEKIVGAVLARADRA